MEVARAELVKCTFFLLLALLAAASFLLLLLQDALFGHLRAVGSA